MKVSVVLIVAAVTAVESSLLPSYSLPNPGPPPAPGPSYILPNPGPAPGPVYNGGGGGISCGNGQVFHNGGCVTPEVSRNVYVYNVPQIPRPSGPRPYVPHPKVEHNVIFVRLPEEQGSEGPIVVPPPQQKHIVYVLKKQQQDSVDVINVPTPPKTNPEVYYVNYGNGENPILPTGEDLQSALANNAQVLTGQVVDGGSSGSISIGGIGGQGTINPGNLYSPPVVTQPQPLYSAP